MVPSVARDMEAMTALSSILGDTGHTTRRKPGEGLRGASRISPCGHRRGPKDCVSGGVDFCDAERRPGSKQDNMFDARIPPEIRWAA